MKQFFTFLLLVLSTTVVAQTFCYEDKDGDGYGNPSTITATFFGSCPLVGGPWVNIGGDCDDTERLINPNVVWYQDADNDKYYSGDGITQCLSPGPGYKTSGLLGGGDCNDNNRFEFPGQAWWVDPDGDGYLTYLAAYTSDLPPELTFACIRPNGYIAGTEIPGSWPDNQDCNGNDPLEHPNQRWYKDEDGDKYPSDLTIKVACARPSGYSAEIELIALTLDCADDDASLNPGTEWGIDLDNDGYYVGFLVTQCNAPSADYKKTAFLGGDDCDDNDPVVHPNQAWVHDNDLDKYQPLEFSIVQCTRPPGYFAITEMKPGIDCNDGNGAINPGATETCDNVDNNCNGQIDEGFTAYEFVLDADGDGYYPGTPIVHCSSPGEGYIILTHIVSIGGVFSNKHPGDCDDTNPALNPASKWVVDGDGDGYYPGSPIVQCLSPGAGYILITQIPIVPVGLVPNKSPGDCNDNVPGIKPNATELCDGVDNDCDGLIDEGVNLTFYKDFDRDGYGDAAISVQACSTPPGYVSNYTDCNDNAQGIHPGATEVCDEADNDCDGLIDEGVQLTFYKDFDGDGYGNAAISVQACSAPEGHVSNNADCNDSAPAINPATVWYKDADNDRYSEGTPQTQCERPTGYKLLSELKSLFGYSFGDCDDDNGAIHPETVWYQDFDNDKYSNGFGVMTCGRATGWKLQSELTATSGDCNDNNININPATVWYKDADNDGFSNGITQTQCTRPTGYKLLSELVSISGDCNDNNPAINPAAAEVCRNNIDDNCNGVVDDKAACEKCSNASNLTTTNITSASAQLNWSAIANSEQWRVQYKSTKPNSKWVVAPLLAGTIRSVTISSLVANQNYSWQIGAKCNGTWTVYSASVNFKTLASGASGNRPNNSTISSSKATILSNPTLRLYPNPNRGQFMLDLHVDDKINATAMIQLIDITGKTVQTQNAEIYRGILQKTIKVSSALLKGIYLVRIIVNDKVYKTNLVYVK